MGRRVSLLNLISIDEYMNVHYTHNEPPWCKKCHLVCTRDWSWFVQAVWKEMIIANMTVTSGRSHVDITPPRNSNNATELYGEKKGLQNMQQPSMLISLPRKQLYGSYEGTTINMNVNKRTGRRTQKQYWPWGRAQFTPCFHTIKIRLHRKITDK
jgi:hypothetical protein